MFRLASDVKQAPFVGQINQAANNALNSDESHLKSPKQVFPGSPGRFEQPLKWLAKLGDVNFSGKDIEFLNAEAARYLKGVWLEHQIYFMASSLGFDEVHCGVVIGLADGDGSRNELDVLVIHNNLKLIIECKTLSQSSIKTKASEVIYHLDSVSKAVLGSQATRWLISVNDFGVPGKRARSHDVIVSSGAKLLKIKEALENWKSSGKLPEWIDDAHVSVEALAEKYSRH